VTFFDQNGVRIVPLEGEYDIANCDALEEVIAAALQGENAVILDFTGAVYIDSSVLTVVARMKKRAGERLRIVVPPGGQIRRVFDVTGLRTGLSVKDSIEAASTDGD
jgi:anti-anti-sigma factor